MKTLKIKGLIADKYHGCGMAIATVRIENGQIAEITDLLYLRDFDENLDEEDEWDIKVTNHKAHVALSPKCAPKHMLVSGMCSCYEFVIL